MRSQVACTRCRTSKIRCVNRGFNTDCDQCIKSQRNCSYTPSNISSGTSKRRDSNVGAVHDGPNGRSAENASKKRKIAPSANALKGGPSGSWDLLNPQLFTRQTWDELFGIFEQHFATDLPFLHAPTFTKHLRKVDVTSLVDPFASLLYAFLALTTPFHSTFVEHPWCGSGRRSTPLEISERYADAARSRLRNSNAYQNPSLDTTHALLMIGLHEWRTRQGVQCFLTIGTAINCAEILWCHKQPDLYDDEDTWPSAQSTPAKSVKGEASLEDQYIIAETKRRTYWCCFILDSYVSSGENRRQKVRIDEINIQLPCSQKAFELGKNVRTMMLDEGETQQDFNTRHFPSGDRRLDPNHDLEFEDERDQEGLTWFIKALTVYRGVSDWVCNVTRRREKRSPWDRQSRFYKLKKKLEQLQQHLSRDLRLTSRNTDYYIRTRGTSRSYVQLHSVLALCDMALHREYIAFLPWDQPKPRGPIDGPHLPEPPPTYWEDNARACFKAAKDFNELAWACSEEGVLVETPVVGFAMFYVVQIVIWCRFFPHQDEENYLCSCGGRDDKLLCESVDKATLILHSMQDRLPMARMWCRDAKDYMEELTRLRKERPGIGESPTSNSSNSTDGSYRGAAHWTRIVKRLGLTNFGRTEDDKLDNDTDGVTDIRNLDHASEPSSPHAVKSESEEASVGTPRTFTTVQTIAQRQQLQNGATPKPMDEYSHPLIPGPYTPSYPAANIYSQQFGPPTNGVQTYPVPVPYHPTESKERDSLSYAMHNPNMAPIPPPQVGPFNHPIPNHQDGSQTDWNQAEQCYAFAAGNGNMVYSFENGNMMESHGYLNPYPNYGGGT